MEFVVLNILIYCKIIRLKHAATFPKTTDNIYVVIDG